LTWTYPDPRKPSGFASGSGYSALTVPTYYVWPPASGQSVSTGWVPGTYAVTTDSSPQPPLPQGYSQYEPESGWTPLAGRFLVAQLLGTGRADWSWFARLCGAFTFDQERTGLGKTISRQVWNIIHGTTEVARENEELRTTDPRTILIDLAL